MHRIILALLPIGVTPDHFALIRIAAIARVLFDPGICADCAEGEKNQKKKIEKAEKKRKRRRGKETDRDSIETETRRRLGKQIFLHQLPPPGLVSSLAPGLPTTKRNDNPLLIPRK